MSRRTSLQRLEAIPIAIKRGEEFRARVSAAAGDAIKCADLMAEAIDAHRMHRILEPIGHSGKATFCMEELQDCYCLDAARTEYLRARAAPFPPLSPQCRRLG